MASNSKIQWTQATWNPHHGCRKISAECKFCYMKRDKEKFGQKNHERVKKSTKPVFEAPLKWDDPKLIFTCSWSDLFVEEAEEWMDEIWEIIRKTPQHTYQVLTKRPERIRRNLPEDWEDGYNNVWLGVSGGKEDGAFERMSLLKDIPAKLKFLSAEPLLEDICSERNKKLLGEMDWVIIGGESGNDNGKWKYRPMELMWATTLINVCQSINTPVFVKQLGTYQAKQLALKDRHGSNLVEWPKVLKVRDMPY